MYNFVKWDMTSPVNGIDASDVIKSLGNPTDVYLINDGDKTAQIQTNKEQIYGDLSIEDWVTQRVEEMNVVLETQSKEE